jgi:hypothetical protein
MEDRRPTSTVIDHGIGRGTTREPERTGASGSVLASRGGSILDSAEEKIPVGESDGFTHPTEELQPGIHVERMGGAVDIKRFAVDELHDQVRSPIVIGTAIVEPGNVGVLQTSQNLSFVAEAVLCIVIDPTRAHDLDGDATVIFVVAPAGEIDCPHSSFADQPLEPVWTDVISGPFRHRLIVPHHHRQHLMVEEAPCSVEQFKQFFDFLSYLRIVSTLLIEIPLAFVSLQAAGVVKQPLYPVGVHPVKRIPVQKKGRGDGWWHAAPQGGF